MRNQAMRGLPLRGLRLTRLRRAMSQRELATTAGLSEATIVRLETGERPAFPSTVKRLADALGVEPATLYGEEGQE